MVQPQASRGWSTAAHRPSPSSKAVGPQTRAYFVRPLVLLQLRKLGKSLWRFFPALGTKLWPLSSIACLDGAAVPTLLCYTISLVQIGGDSTRMQASSFLSLPGRPVGHRQKALMAFACVIGSVNGYFMPRCAGCRQSSLGFPYQHHLWAG